MSTSGAAGSSRPTFVLLHEPRCSKSRAAKALLDARNVLYEERRYRELPLGRDELARLRAALGRPAREWLRAGEDEWRACGLSLDAADDVLLDVMAQHPVLIERPILWAGTRAVVGRPPEAILTLLDSSQ